ncbi:hypothetical protein Cgig2_003177 [Carnegiea gigantea]|uniref:Uncharacterized protein n=1 Tax=Carnegiea gigantea TaxID=171969 RepID=A0A9Q1K2T9_9CARY|nr:hypothetical protein Cgig2_003177 [Carnegiea gigantea]
MGENELVRLQSSMLIVAYHGFFQATWVAEIMLRQNLLEPPVPKVSIRRAEQGINTSESHKVNHSHLLRLSNIQVKVLPALLLFALVLDNSFYVEILFGSFLQPRLLWLQNDQSWSQNISIMTFNGCILSFVEVIRCNALRTSCWYGKTVQRYINCQIFLWTEHC